MIKKFDILKTETGLVVVTLNNNRLDEVLFEVEQQLKLEKYKGNLLFDLLLTNGQSTNRFIHTSFNGSRMNTRALKVIESNKVGIKPLHAISRYHFKHVNQIKNSFLSSLQKSKIIERLELAND